MRRRTVPVRQAQAQARTGSGPGPGSVRTRAHSAARTALDVEVGARASARGRAGRSSQPQLHPVSAAGRQLRSRLVPLPAAPEDFPDVAATGTATAAAAGANHVRGRRRSASQSAAVVAEAWCTRRPTASAGRTPSASGRVTPKRRKTSAPSPRVSYTTPTARMSTGGCGALWRGAWKPRLKTREEAATPPSANVRQPRNNKVQKNVRPKVLVSCQNDGCSDRFPPDELAAHQNKCMSCFPCPLACHINCHWHGAVNCGVGHLKSNHAVNCAKGPSIVLPLDNWKRAAPTHWVTVQNCLGQYFIIVIQKIVKNRCSMFLGSVKIFAEQEAADRFEFSMTLKTQANRRTFSYTSVVRALHEEETTENKNDYFVFDSSCAELFSTGNDLLEVERFRDLEDGIKGNLFGLFHDGTLFIVGFGATDNFSEATQSDTVSFNFLPTEILLCGAFTVDSNVQVAQKYFQTLSENVKCLESPIFLSQVRDGPLSFICHDNTLTKIEFDTMSKSQLTSCFIFFRTKAEFAITAEKSHQYIQLAFDDVRKKVLSDDIAFHIASKNLFLSGKKGSDLFGSSGVNPCNHVKELIHSQRERSNKDLDILSTYVHLKLTKDFDQENIHDTVPYIRQIRRLIGPFQSTKIFVKIDVVSLVHRDALIGTLYNVFKKSFLHGISLIEANLLQQIANGQEHSISCPEIFHFFPEQSNFFISTAYAKNHCDSDLRKQREQLHKSFGFPLDQPLFRKSQAYVFSSGESSKSGPLINPHLGLKSGMKGGCASLVKGRYHYHHYMQDRFDDNGWGCAYRSLQTIVSWFRLQGYTEVQVPTHKQIQECLVKIGDKPSSFIGSRQWIGSTEVSFVLESLLGVSCKILTASTGEEVGCLGSELQYHFQTNGTPVMIGGGVLAHTIIGIDYSRSTGDIKFLILDPHYTGGEDLSLITGKGWVGWKDVKFWTKNAFYNLCLPLRPIGDL